MQDLVAIILKVIIIGFPILIAITFHEAAHGFIALKYGDDTALRQGRVTFNPLKHIDPIGTVLIPALLLMSGSKFLFGYAKPVPVNFRHLNNPKRDMILVAGAGPATNLILAIASAIGLKIMYSWFAPATFSGTEPGLVFAIVLKSLEFSLYINVLLAVFNMLPLPPLDGGRVAVGLLPSRPAYYLARLEPFGIFILLGLIFLVPLVTTALGYPINLFALLLLPPVEFMVNLISWLVGL